MSGRHQLRVPEVRVSAAPQDESDNTPTALPPLSHLPSLQYHAVDTPGYVASMLRMVPVLVEARGSLAARLRADRPPPHWSFRPCRNAAKLTENDIKNVFETFGPITYCKLAQGTSAHKHKGYGFIEYATLAAALEVIVSMNLFDLGGQHLRVGRAITQPAALAGASTVHVPMPTAVAVTAAVATAKIQAMDAVASNSVALGLTKLNALGVSPAAALPTLAAALPNLPAALPVTLPVTLPAALPVTLPAALGALPVLLPAALPATLPTTLPVVPAVLPAAIPPPGVVIPLLTPIVMSLRHQKSVSNINSESGMPGAFFSYELSPLMVKYTEKERSIGHFATNVCAIVGGVFTVAGIIDALLYHSLNTFQNKMMLGKAG
ncbi:unnamed protein product [Parnassius apollo]|uniref:(apollo) hypothetical protein n=1 Tax=Parnassius apollo TaxID=110799 RepID=A0A8S3XHX2_PARAO|nr:unnamed protein product [Parnassius apollo]